MFIPDPNFFHPGPASKNLSIINPKTITKLSEIRTGLFIPNPDLDFLPDPGVKKAPDPESGSLLPA
jgi:hypothetical protein